MMLHFLTAIYFFLGIFWLVNLNLFDGEKYRSRAYNFPFLMFKIFSNFVIIISIQKWLCSYLILSPITAALKLGL